MKKILSVLLLTSCALNVSHAAPKNIIMVIGDGMGPAYTSAYRYLKDDPSTDLVEETVFDRHLIGMSSTYPHKVSGYVTDSAAGATALSTGVKTYNGAVALDVDKHPIETVLENAYKHGKSIGVVVTSQVNHATPAGYLAHNESRKNYNAIADSYLDNGWKTDILLGGGWKYFLREDRNLVTEITKTGVHYVDHYNQLANLPTNKAIFGLFADKGLPWAIDDTNKHRLSTMTQAATQHLLAKNNDKGFFMLIEASQIDWGGHGNDIVAAMGEMDDLAKTMEYLETFVKQHPDTLVVLTADHSTGGLTIAANGEYKWDPAIIRAMKHSAKVIAKELTTHKITKPLLNKLFNFTLNDDEVNLLITTKKSPHQDSKNNLYADKNASVVEQALLNAIKALIDQRTNTGWTSTGHTAVDVPVFALGENKDDFSGLKDNTDIAKRLFKLIKNK
jgi:alkaline phosphatase